MKAKELNMDKNNDAIHRRMADMPKAYRKVYQRAMTGRSRKAAMRAMCLECCGWQRVEVANCSAPNCPLYPYRPDRVPVGRVLSSQVR